MANNFSGDPYCKALYNFESGALVTDSKSTNTLTDYNTVGTSTTYFKQGAASASFIVGNLESLYRIDGDLTAGFPLKNGDTTKIISVCAWFRFESYTVARAIVTKWDSNTGTDRRSFKVVLETDGKVRLVLGYNGGVSGETKSHGSVLSVNTWYHVTATYAGDATKAYTLRIKDTNGDTVGTDLDATATLDANGLNVEDAAWVIGAQWYNSIPNNQCFNGQIDEVVFFNDIITADEATAIAKGLYPKAVLTGTAMASITEADVVAGGKTIIITLTGDTWIT